MSSDPSKTTPAVPPGIKDPQVTEPLPAAKGHSILFHEVGGGEEAKPAFMIKVPEADIPTKTLADLQTMIKNNSQTKEYSRLSFATSHGAVVDHVWYIKDYLEEVNKEDPEPSKGGDQGPQEKDKTPKEKDPAAQNNKEVDTKERISPIVPTNPSTPSISKGYLKRSAEWRKITESNLPKVEVTLPSIPDYIKAPAGKDLKTNIVKADWKAAAGTTQSKAGELKESDWRVVTINNALLYGLSVVRQPTGNGKSTPIGLIRAPYPAFRLKQRKVIDPEDTQEAAVRVPDYIVDDQSYVAIYETKTHFQKSLSKSSIDETDISGSIGFPAFGGVLGIGFGVKTSASSQEETDNSGESSQMNISYNFPRVTLRLDEYSLEMTDDCKKELKEASNLKPPVADGFLEKFGEYFSTQVQLGGKLWASDEFDSSSESHAKDVKFSLKVQAAASFKAVPEAGQGSGSLGVGHGTGEANTSSNSQSATTLQWQANGGNTLLANDPPNWCPTVGSHDQWRIINRAGNRHILNLIARFKDDETVDQVKKLVTEDTIDPTLPSHQHIVPRQGRMFYLRKYPDGAWNEHKYLTAYQKGATEWREKDISELKKVSGPLPDECGTVMLYNSLQDCHKWGCYLEFQTPQGHGITKVMYGEPYVLRNPSTELYFTVKSAAKLDDQKKHSQDKDGQKKDDQKKDDQKKDDQKKDDQKKDDQKKDDQKKDDPAPTTFPVAITETPTDGYWFLRGREGADKGPVKQDDEVTLRWRSGAPESSSSSKDQILNIFHETGWAGLLKTTDRTEDTVEESTLLFRWKDIWDKS